MATWLEVLEHFAVNAEEQFDRLKYGLGKRLGADDPIVIVPYRGFGTSERIYLRGRVLEQQNITAPEDNDSLWENLHNMYLRFESDEVPFARIRARIAGDEREVQADEEGYFEVWLEPKEPLPTDRLWQTVELELIEPNRSGFEVRAEGLAMVPPRPPQFGVISDLDDTVVHTDVTSMLRMARTVFLSNARTRLPFEGVAAFYRALHAGDDGRAWNPLFYVSGSPWNMYDLLTDFLQLNEIPAGPVLLRDWGISEDADSITNNRSHKIPAIRKIMDLYPDLKFILIGDSTQEDPEIYREVQDLYPNRILAIYIRNVNRTPARMEQIEALAAEVSEAGSTLVLADNTVPLAQHAIAQNWVSAEKLPDVVAEKRADEAPAGKLEQLLGEEPKAKGPTVVVSGEEAEAKQAEREGAVEEALKKGDESKQEAPTVVVKGENDRDEKK